MDPKSPNNLDPKLKEVYDRVMGTNTTPIGPADAPTGPQPTPSTPQPPMPTPAMPSTPPAPSMPAAQTPITKPETPAMPPIASISTPAPAEHPVSPSPVKGPDHLTTPPLSEKPASTPHAATSTAPTHVNVAPPAAHDEESKQVKKGSSFMKVFFIITGVLFLSIYAVFWMKYFNIPIPFLP